MLGPIRQATATWALAVALFGAVFALRLVVDAPGEAVGILFVVPIALLASRLGVAAGALGAVIALVLIATWVQVRDVPLGPLGWASRAVVFGLTGLALGWYAERLRAERALARRLVAEAPEALMDVDARGCVVDANPACEGLFAVGPGGLAGRPLAELVPARLASWRPALLDFLAAPGFRSLRDVDGLAVRTADGEEVPVDVT
ncbi:MAG: hypothetical protein HZB46_03485, partial [Solirubrobacterales bacterium]|nr:hypothetical protein [Solirubrobacterales bacterium]